MTNIPNEGSGFNSGLPLTLQCTCLRPRPGYKLIEIPEDCTPFIIDVGPGGAIRPGYSVRKIGDKLLEVKDHDMEGNLTRWEMLDTDEDGNEYMRDMLVEVAR